MSHRRAGPLRHLDSREAAAVFNPGQEKTMKQIRNTLIGLCVAAATLGAAAQGADEHKEHHPERASPPAARVKKTPAMPMGADRMVAMDQHMKAMQAMHEKMAAAKTPEERQALMAEHMKLMQDGMAMMQQMGGMQDCKGMGGDMASRQQLMEKRMDMMESMMQMMMDRLPPAPAQ
jgi:hypothetical protein